MAQADVGTIDASATSGVELAALLSAWGTALKSNNSGTSRPSYITAGGIWLDTTANPWLLKFYTGSADIVMLSLNTVSSAVTFSGTVPAPSLPAFTPPTRQVATTFSITGGGDLTADRTLQLVNDQVASSIPSNYYYGTGGTAAVLGWWPVNGAGRPAVVPNIRIGPTTVSWTAPAGVTNVYVEIYAGGGADTVIDGSAVPGGNGGRASGQVPVTPGSSYTITVGDVGGSSSFATFVTVTAGATGGSTTNGSATIGSGLNVSAIAPLIAGPSGVPYGSHNAPGLVILKWIQNL